MLPEALSVNSPPVAANAIQKGRVTRSGKGRISLRSVRALNLAHLGGDTSFGVGLAASILAASLSRGERRVCLVDSDAAVSGFHDAIGPGSVGSMVRPRPQRIRQPSWQ